MTEQEKEIAALLLEEIKKTHPDERGHPISHYNAFTEAVLKRVQAEHYNDY